MVEALVGDENRRLASVVVTGDDEPSTGRLLASDVFTAPLPDESRAGLWVEGGWPTASVRVLDTVGDATVEIWELTDGVVSDIERDECFLVLRGSGVLRFEGGEGYDLRPGAFLRLREGDRAEWTITNPLRILSVTRSNR